jgi:acyl carrier protein
MDELTAILNEVRPGQNFAEAENFFDQGMLDSLDMTTLVSALESRYGIFVDVDEIVPDNFRNLAAIRTFLASKGVSVSAIDEIGMERRPS